MTAPLSAFAGISDRYDGFIFDVWGTLYDGGNAFPGALETVKALAERDKKILVLSNSPRIPVIVGERLKAIGFELGWFTEIVTSGGMVADIVGGRRDAASAALGERVLWLGQERFPDTVPAGSFTVVQDAGEADWVLNAGPEISETRLEDFETVLSASAERGLPMVCANPDKSVLQSGAQLLCAGAMAERYEEMGGPVRYFGKPYPEIFARCLDRIGLPADRVLVVGDNLETDILGANRTGIDSLLLGCGIHAVALAESGGAGEGLVSLVASHGARPTYFSDALVW
ncbi:TIGR01459 family HAD-type hydrolase [uncultured Nisaea sp.]|uniref:TIGR01459 family HAD-type hydrolase n=1 Tax=uncultured Nisaea sp. TaxID=538215 RepID=UPI0030EC1B22|tara:strand:- start:1963 stop:2820 length:858 start_codon:yes stop_codon:yes gene_type:complete